MKKFFSVFANDDGGEIMIESTIVIFITISLMLIMISLGFLFYQQAMIKTVANEIASGIASNYKYSERGDSYHVSDISYAEINGLRRYRTTFRVNYMKSDYDEIASSYVVDRVALTNLGLNSSDPQIESLEFSMNNVGRLRVDVVVSLESDFLFSGLLKSLDIIDETPTFKGSASAECMDLTSYTGTVNLQRYLVEKFFGEGTLGDSAVKIYNSVTNLINTFFG
ncbi:hypothetical protein GX865_05000 [Candidatus Saccharibacteria bacterium]|nr:hypothetical protein [Candidatus Saccharibacteria bacterium]